MSWCQNICTTCYICTKQRLWALQLNKVDPDYKNISEKVTCECCTSLFQDRLSPKTQNCWLEVWGTLIIFLKKRFVYDPWRQPHPILSLNGFDISHLKWCSMHALNLGVLQFVTGSSIDLLCSLGAPALRKAKFCFPVLAGIFRRYNWGSRYIYIYIYIFIYLYISTSFAAPRLLWIFGPTSRPASSNLFGPFPKVGQCQLHRVSYSSMSCFVFTWPQTLLLYTWGCWVGVNFVWCCHILGIHKATWLLACCTLKDFRAWPLKHTMDVWCWCFSICVWQHTSDPRGMLVVHQVLKWLMLHLLLERCVAGTMQWSERGGTWRGMKLIRFTIMGSVFLKTYQRLGVESVLAHSRRWKYIPKLHVVHHLLEDMKVSLVNCRFTHCFKDEDNVGLVKRLAVRVHKGNLFEYRILTRWLLRLDTWRPWEKYSACGSLTSWNLLLDIAGYGDWIPYYTTQIGNSISMQI